MADRLTQLQGCLDDLLMQMYATLSYIQTHHPYGEIPGQPSQAPQDETSTTDPAPRTTTTGTANGSDQRSADTKELETDAVAIKNERGTTPMPEAPDTFRAALRELAQDLVVQEQKAEILIGSLPGIGNSERDQQRRMQELEDELKRVEGERAKAEEERLRMLGALNGVIVGLRQV